MVKNALITGVEGQDGSYLAEFLLRKGYKVHGTYLSENNLANISHLPTTEGLTLHRVDLRSASSINCVVEKVAPDEVYNLASQSSTRVSFEQPVLDRDVNFYGLDRVLQAVLDYAPTCKVFQASSAQMYGQVDEIPQSEKTPFNPISPYGFSKRDAHYLVEYYRETYDLFVCAGILFNHESPRRPTEFVTRYITRTAAKIKQGLENELRLANPDARRDWGFAGEYVEAMWLMLQSKEPKDYVIATGASHTIREFADIVFKNIDLDYEKYLVVDRDHIRLKEVHNLHGDISLIREELGWNPKLSMAKLAELMITADLGEIASKI